MLDYMVRFGIPVDLAVPAGAETMSIKVFGHELSYLLFKVGKEFTVASRMLVQYKAAEALEDITVVLSMKSDDEDAIKLALSKEAHKSLSKHLGTLADEATLKALLAKTAEKAEAA